ncbi:MAG: protein phosphatase 2C domain-containing protein [Ktedonobacteraceae bacterium]
MRTLSYLQTMPGTRRFLAGVFSCFIGGLLLMALLLPSLAFAASPGGYQFGKSQALDQASVSVVRLVIGYQTTIPKCASASELGAIVASTQASSASFTNWVLTDGSLLEPASLCPNQQQKVSSIQIYASAGYNSSSLELANISCSGLTCQNNTRVICQSSQPCTNNAALVSFVTSKPLPFVTVPQTADQSFIGVGLTTMSLASATPQPFATPVQATTALTPTAIVLARGGEPGMPIVDIQGNLVSMVIQNNADSSIVTFVNAERNALQIGQANQEQIAWNSAVNDFYSGAKNKIPAELQQMIKLNPDFLASTLRAQISSSQGNSGSNGTSGAQSTATPTSASANQTGLFGLPIAPSLAFVGIVVLVILALIVLVIGLVAWRRKAAIHRQQEEEIQRADKVATLDAQRIRQEEQAQAQAHAQPAAQAQQGWEQWQQQNARVNAPPLVPAPPLAPLQLQPPVPVTPPAPVYQQSPSLRCPNCGAPINPGDKFCSQCRTALLPSDSSLYLRMVNSPAGIADAPTVEMSPDQMQTMLGQSPAGMDAERTQPFPKQLLIPAPHHGRFVVATRSDRGYKRKYKPNEDSLFAAVGAQSPSSPFQDLGIFVVADGMGGHANGKDASNLAIQTIQERIVPELQSGASLRDEDYIRLLKDGVQSANLAVHQRNVEQRADMGTTMTAALIVDTVAYVANVGDSRTYLYRQSEGLKKITNDHSVVASLVTAGIINAEDVYTHPKRNQIYRSLGEKPDVEVDVFSVPLQPGDILLLCCDGLWEMTRDNIIQEILLTMPDPAQAGQALIEAALHGGGDDNISVVLAKVDDALPASGARDFEVLATPDKPQYPPMPNGSDD